MKTDKITLLIFFLINIAVALSCYFYPVTRDEFYYLNNHFKNPFVEYYDSYFLINPRIGQFFSNAVSRNIVLEVIFGVLLFNGYFSMIFLNIFRRFPNFRRAQDVQKFLVVAAFFIFLISYFGEMFYYTPFSGNYTFTHIFYLFFVYLFTEYYLFGNDAVLNKINVFLLALFGLFIGVCNEHVPPVLLIMSFFAAVYFLIKNRKLPNFRFLILPVFIFFGYLLLFFAPANKIKQKVVGKSVLDVGLNSYAANVKTLKKIYYYYNIELILAVFLIGILAFIFRKKIFKSAVTDKRIAVYLAFAFLPLLIVAVSPLIGTRLLFFSSTLVIMVLILILKQFNSLFNFKKAAVVTSYVFLSVFFVLSILITFNGRRNYQKIISEIESQNTSGKNVVLQSSFDYFTPSLGLLNRLILLERGSDYIDKNPSHDTSVEMNLKLHHQFNTLRVR